MSRGGEGTPEERGHSLSHSFPTTHHPALLAALPTHVKPLKRSREDVGRCMGHGSMC